MNDLTRKQKRMAAKIEVCKRCLYFTALLPCLNGYHLDSQCYQFKALSEGVIILPMK